MPIVNMLDNNAKTFPDGARCVIGGYGAHVVPKLEGFTAACPICEGTTRVGKWNGESPDVRPKCTECNNGSTHEIVEYRWTGVLVLGESYVGACLKEYERNGYDDSDFHMIVWDEETQSAKDILFASTRGWSYPCLASRVDATDEVKAKYAAWCKMNEKEAEARRRHSKAVALVKMRAEVRKAAKANDFPAYRLQALRKRYEPGKFAAIVDVITNARIRNGFKLKMRAAVIAWCKEERPKYPTPLTTKQLAWIM